MSVAKQNSEGFRPQATQALLRQFAEPLPDLDTVAFGELFDRFGDAKAVLIGEASHGTSEFYKTRAAITQRLIEQHGFSIVAVEADWPDAGQIDRFVRGSRPRATDAEAFRRFPAWMWRNTDVETFSHWLRAHNEGLRAPARVEFRGLDIYSLRHSITQVLFHLDRVDPRLAREARQRYGCLTPWQDDPALYGHFVERDGVTPCEDKVVAQLRSVLDERLTSFAADDEAFFDAVQNARVVRAAEQYYRAMYQGSAASWNLRDQHMFDTLQALLSHRGESAKAVVWAHNSHIGDARATAMGQRGELNLGQLCRETYGPDAVLIGMSTDRGEVAAAHDWGSDGTVMKVRPSLKASWEHQFLQAGISASLTDWRGEGREALRQALSAPLLERAIGVIYRPATERYSHYFEAELSRQFDALVWLETTSALTPVPGWSARHEDEDTFPFGV